jgi:hypothetical protein
MKTGAGVWIDHRKAVVVIITGTSEEMWEIASDSSEDKSDRRFNGHLHKYYDEVVASLRDADAILIFGWADAKAELEERLAQEAVHGDVVHLEPPPRMMERRMGPGTRRRVGRVLNRPRADVGRAGAHP